MSNEGGYKSHILYYYIGWALIIGSLIFAKHIMNLYMFIFDMILIPIIIVIIGIIRFYTRLKVSEYIDRFHKEKWDDIYKRYGIHGKGTEVMPKVFLFSKEYYGDPILNRLKQNYREYMVFSYIVFFSYFIYLTIDLS